MGANVATAGNEWYRLLAQRYFRAPRMRAFERAFRLDSQTHVLDVGGTPFNWRLVAARPRVTTVNLAGEEGRSGNVEMLLGDATALTFPDGSFDVVYSNSVIEHVGGSDKVEAYARHIRRLGPRYYVQTPNLWFPIEPHCMGLILHWFPMPIRRRLYRWLSLSGWRNRPPQERIDRYLPTVRLLKKQELQRLFPDATIIAERTWLFPFIAKSYIAVRN